MSELVFGQRMVRLDDGQKGVVGQDGPDLRILYLDRGEERRALKTERWIPDEIRPGRMRPAERFLIAATCDRALRAYERHEPHKHWETIPLNYQPYDPDLMQLIEGYLATRPTRPATTD